MRMNSTIAALMRCICVAMLLRSLPLPAGEGSGGGNSSAGEQTIDLESLMQSANDWASENLDEQALSALQTVDQEQVRKFFEQVQQEFKGEYVIDLAQLRTAAAQVLPILESYKETAPYAAWLRARMDYLEVADQLRLLIPPPPQKPSQPGPPRVNPPPKLEREVWIKELESRPWPDKAKPYVSKLKPIFAAQKVPGELVWIAEVESAFDPDATSPVGAGGLFQLMPATAKRYGLRRWPFDQRFQPEPSARAAAQYLDYLHRKFKDWRLALAAYNSGEGTVQRLLAKQQTKTFDAIAPHLPAETQMYVPRIEAVLHRREGLKLSDLTVPKG